jgi:hypothetical protein
MSCHMGASSCPTCLAHTTANVDLSAMADCCSALLGFGGVIHGDSDSEPTGGPSHSF